jgi:hypothetical protein
MLLGQMSPVRLSSGHDDFPCTILGQDVAHAANRTVGCASGRSNRPIRSIAADPTNKYDPLRQIRQTNMIGCGRSDRRIRSSAADPTNEGQRMRWILRTAMDAPAADPTNRQRIFLVNFRSAAIQIGRSHGQVPNWTDINSIGYWIASDSGFSWTADFSKGRRALNSKCFWRRSDPIHFREEI